jgi:hypothetical protein
VDGVANLLAVVVMCRVGGVDNAVMMSPVVLVIAATVIR